MFEAPTIGPINEISDWMFPNLYSQVVAVGPSVVLTYEMSPEHQQPVSTGSNFDSYLKNGIMPFQSSSLGPKETPSQTGAI
jgi:hypothetical protein